VRTVLVIDDNPAVASALELLFGMHDIRTLAAATPGEGLAALEGDGSGRDGIGLVIADMNFSADTTSGEEGAALFRAIRARHPDLPVILLTGWTHLASAVQLIKAGAADYVAKPWDNERLLASVENLLELSESNRERSRLQRQRRQRREQLAQRYQLGEVVFESEAMEAAVELACRVARAPVPVLITGPSGAGKERIAAILHANSSTPGGPLVAVNCGALPPELFEAELFGAEAGAFTGAQRARAGRFEAADGGTLFLDEIGNLPLSGQMKLLRVLETGQYEPLGSSRTRTARVRIVSASNADLPAMIREGRFREDLYYRLNVIEIAVPPLAERRDDILPLAEHFLGGALQLGEEAREALLRHGWPGDVRELRNCIERARLLAADSTVSAIDLGLPPAVETGTAGSGSERREADHWSREAIEASLRAAGGNISRAAQRLGMSRQAFYRRLERFGLRP
jgi:DNA-binding NtrC family response regulator